MTRFKPGDVVCLTRKSYNPEHPVEAGDICIVKDSICIAKDSDTAELGGWEWGYPSDGSPRRIMPREPVPTGVYTLIHLRSGREMFATDEGLEPVGKNDDTTTD